MWAPDNPGSSILGTIFHAKCNQKIIKKTITKQLGIWCQRGPKMEPKTMPKRIKNQCQNKYRNRSWKSSKIMFLWRVKSLKFIVKTILFDGLEGCTRERKRYQQKHQKWDQNPTPNRWTSDTNFMLEKGIPKTKQIINNVIKKRSEKWEETKKKDMRKQIEQKDLKNSKPEMGLRRQGTL